MIGLDAPRVLTQGQVSEYEERGFLIVRGVFSPAEMALVSMEADRLSERAELIHTNNLRCRWKNHAGSGECLFETFDPVIDLSPLIASLARDVRMLNLVADLYGEPGHLFKDKLIYKPAGIHGYDLHQDYISWPTFPRTFLTAAVAIDASTAGNGATEVFPGYHKQGYLSPEDGEYHQLPLDAVDEAAGVLLELQPGDVGFFGGYVPHRSGPNNSSGTRRLLYLSYNADSDGGERRAAHYEEYIPWLARKYAEYGRHETYFR